MRKITSIGIHCSATRPSWYEGKSNGQKVAEIKRWHVQDRGWSDIGYNYVICRDGEVKNGRPIERTPAHAKVHNKGSVGICLLGGHGGTRDDDFSENFTPAQEVALCDLIDKLKAEHKIRKIWGHNEVSSKACPCFDVKAWLKG